MLVRRSLLDICLGACATSGLPSYEARYLCEGAEVGQLFFSAIVCIVNNCRVGELFNNSG